MFTGLIQASGRIESIQSTAAGARLIVDPGKWTCQPARGDSIAVNGCCLTHAPHDDDPPGRLVFDVVHETLRKTTLGKLTDGARVNLESCLTPSSPIGGHFVLGHVDATGAVVVINTEGGEHQLTIQADDQMSRYVVPTGSIAIDGVSLTVASCVADKNQFTVALIPTTLELTTLGGLNVGDAVNLEGDVLVKAVVHNLPRSG